MFEMPMDAEEIVVVRRGGQVVRWRADDAVFLARLMHGVLSEPSIAPDVPEPVVTQPLRRVTELEGRYVVGLEGDLWLARERPLPPENYQLADLVPDEMRGGKVVGGRRDSFGNAYVLSGPLYQVRVTVEAAVPPEDADATSG